MYIINLYLFKKFWYVFSCHLQSLSLVIIKKNDGRSSVNSRISVKKAWFWAAVTNKNMDKLTLISGTLFMAADIFAIVSLAMPDWIITDVGGKGKLFSEEYTEWRLNVLGDTRLGLMWTCMTLYNRPQVCFTPDLQPEWLLALVCIFVGCICITTTIILLASSQWDRNVIPYARWVGFTASELVFKIC